MSAPPQGPKRPPQGLNAAEPRVRRRMPRFFFHIRNGIGIANFRGGRLTVNHWERRAEAAEFDPRYLH
jgi:hypothetical protein